MTHRIDSPADRTLFVDSSAFLASINPKDASFSAAQRVLGRIRTGRMQLLTTTYVIVEAHALILNRAGREPGVKFLRGLEGSAMGILRPTSDDERRAREIVYTHTDKTYSLTDAISFAVMERLGLTRAFTYDRDFERFGFTRA